MNNTDKAISDIWDSVKSTTDYDEIDPTIRDIESDLKDALYKSAMLAHKLADRRLAVIEQNMI